MVASAADPDRPRWIALADSGPIPALATRLSPERLRVVSNGSVFERLLHAARPRLAIIAVPPATIHDVTVAIDERRRRSTLRIVHVSRPVDKDGRVDALRAGFDEALVDSVDLDELEVRLSLLDEGAGLRTSSPLSIAGEVVLDPVAHQVRRGNEPIHLRPKEYQLLAILAAHPGRVYTRRQLLDRVWGRDHPGDPRTVDVHVRWLRSKIEPQPESPVHLVTVRGVGYRLDPAPRWHPRPGD